MNLPNKPRVLASTYNPISNTKIISFLVDFPTVLLAELRTHRILTQGSLYEHSELVDFNLSANSARAIPHNKYLKKVLDNPFIPIWTKQQKGMSGNLLEDIEDNNSIWESNIKRSDFSNEFPNKLIDTYEDLINKGVHKQNANRLLAPFAYTTCIMTGTEWDNFFSLRLSKDAQPEFREIALMLKELYDNADWKESRYHIPFEDEITKLYSNKINEHWRSSNGFSDGNSPEFYHFGNTYANSIEMDEYYEYVMKISASMCAKLSYNTQDNEDTLEKHLERAEMLIKHKHQEPFSHQAVAMNKDEFQMFYKSMIKKGYQEIEYGWCYNIRGFKSFRYILENY